MDLYVLINRALQSDSDIFETICRLISNAQCATCADIKRKKKLIGDTWEALCKAYLLSQGFLSVQLLSELVDSELSALGLRRKDVGIDMVCRDATNKYVAVQCKFRSRGNVSWKELSTFDALCARSGPWDRQLTITNARRVVREGLDQPKDESITRVSFQRMKRHHWLGLLGMGEGHICGGCALQNYGDVRAARLRHFSLASKKK